MMNEPTGAAWERARDERNWMIFAITEADEKGKRGKFPVRYGRMAWPCSGGSEAAATLTLDEAKEAIERIKIDKVNEARAGKNAAPVARYQVGYIPRRGSAMVVLDFDDCMADGEITDPDIAALIKQAESVYCEVSSSGTGLRVLMQRADADDEAGGGGERNGIGIGTRGGKGWALTFDCYKGMREAGRDERLMAWALALRGVVSSGGNDRGQSLDEQALQYGIMAADDLIALINRAPNPESVDANSWRGHCLCVLEYFERHYPDRLDDAVEALNSWTERWEGDGEHDLAKLDELVNRRHKDSGGITLGSWRHLDRMGRIGPTEVKNGADLVGRYVMVGREYFDRVLWRPLDITELYRHTINAELYSDGPKPKRLGPAAPPRQAWINCHLQKYSGYTFTPGEDEEVLRDGGRYFNLWRPYTEGTEGDVSLWLQHWDWMYGHESEVILDCLALLFQRPGKKIGYIPVLHGRPGIGKDLGLLPVVRALGDAANGNVGYEELADKYTAWIDRKALCVVQEARSTVFANKGEIAEKMKTIAVGQPETLRVRRMYADYESIPNIVNVFIMTNHADALHVDHDDRRYFIASSDKLPRDEHYYQQLATWIDHNVDAVVWYLRHRQIKHAGNKRPPMTEGKREAIRLSLPPMFDQVERYAEGRSWVSTAMIPLDLDTAAPKSARNRGLQFQRCLEALGFRRVDIPGGERGRLKLRGQSHTIYVRDGVEVPVDKIRHELACEDLAQ